ERAALKFGNLSTSAQGFVLGYLLVDSLSKGTFFHFGVQTVHQLLVAVDRIGQIGGVPDDCGRYQLVGVFRYKALIIVGNTGFGRIFEGGNGVIILLEQGIEGGGVHRMFIKGFPVGSLFLYRSKPFFVFFQGGLVLRGAVHLETIVVAFALIAYTVSGIRLHKKGVFEAFSGFALEGIDMVDSGLIILSRQGIFIIGSGGACDAVASGNEFEY